MDKSSYIPSIRRLFAVCIALALVVVAQDSASVSSTTTESLSSSSETLSTESSSTATSSAPEATTSSFSTVPVLIPAPTGRIVACQPNLALTATFAPEATGSFAGFGDATIEIKITNINVPQTGQSTPIESLNVAPTSMGIRLARRGLHHDELETGPRLIPRQEGTHLTSIDQHLSSFQPSSVIGGQYFFNWEVVNVPPNSTYILTAKSQPFSGWVVDSKSDPFFIERGPELGCLAQFSLSASTMEPSATISTAVSPSSTLISGQGYESSASSGLSNGAKAGIAVGVIVGVLALLALLLVLCRRRNIKQRESTRSRRLSGGAMGQKEGAAGTGILASLGVKNLQTDDPESTVGNEGFTVLRENGTKSTAFSKIGAGVTTRNSTLSSTDEKITGSEQVEHRTLLGEVASPTASNSSLRKGSGSSTQELGVGAEVVPALPVTSPPPRVHPVTNKPPSRPPTWDRASTLIEHFDDSVPVSFYEQLQTSPRPDHHLLQEAQSPNSISAALPPIPSSSEAPLAPPVIPIARRGSSSSKRKPAPELPPDLQSVITTSSSAPADPSPLTATELVDVISEDGSLAVPIRQRSVSHGHVPHRSHHLSPPVAAGSMLAAAHQAGSVFTGSKSSLASSVNTQANSIMRTSRNSQPHQRPASEAIPDLGSFAGAKDGPVHYLIPDAPEAHMSTSSGGHSDDAVHAELVSHLNRRHSQQSRLRKPSAQ